MSSAFQRIEAVPFASREDCVAMVDYFLGGTDAELVGMGIELERLPTHEQWVESAFADLHRADRDKERLFMLWLLDGKRVGHSSISHIEIGKSAHCHLHLWEPELRGTGLGQQFLGRSISHYFERFGFHTLVSEPFSENAAPQRTLAKLGFELVRRYLVRPTSISAEQVVARFELKRVSWERRDQNP